MIDLINNPALYNAIFQDQSPEKIVQEVLKFAKKPILTTNFGPYSASLIDVVVRQMPEIPVIWVDTGFNTEETYCFIEKMKYKYNLNLYDYRAREPYERELPEIGTEEHKQFSQQVKIKPFQEAIRRHNPDVWFTNLRKGQTAHRNTMNIFNVKDAILKVCPFYHWNTQELAQYLKHHQLPNEENYFDPTKVLQHRECGIHL